MNLCNRPSVSQRVLIRVEEKEGTLSGGCHGAVENGVEQVDGAGGLYTDGDVDGREFLLSVYEFVVGLLHDMTSFVVPF